MTDNICFECGGRLEPKGGENRVFTYRKGSDFILPSDFLIPTCLECGADFMDETLERRAKDTLRPQFLADQARHIEALLELIRHDSDVSLSEVERACGVTPTYLSHVAKGRKEAGEVLIGILEGFALHPEEVRRRLKRKGAHDTESVLAAAKFAQVRDRWNAHVSPKEDWPGVSLFTKATPSGLRWEGLSSWVPANDCEAA